MYKFLDWADELPWDEITPKAIGFIIMIAAAVVLIDYFIKWLKKRRGL